MERRTSMALNPRAGDRPRTWAVPATTRPRGNERLTKQQRGSLDRDGLKQATLDARVALQEAALAATAAAQRAFAYAEKLDEAMAALQRAEAAPMPALPASRPRITLAAEPLSPREKEVLALVAEGRSNKAIAEALFVSPNTVKSHVASLLTKLRADSRAQLAALAVRGALA